MMEGIQLDGLVHLLQTAFPIYPDANTDPRLALEQFGTQDRKIQVLQQFEIKRGTKMVNFKDGKKRK
jgi:hypothetical protein